MLMLAGVLAVGSLPTYAIEVEEMPIWGYEYVEAFEGDLAKVRLNGKWGMVNAQDDFIVSPSFDTIRYYEEGFCVVAFDGMWCIVDLDYNFLLYDKSFSYIGEYGEGLFVAADTNGLYGYIDIEGNWVIAPQFGGAGKFSEGLARIDATTNNDHRIPDIPLGYIDKTGQMVISLPQHESAEIRAYWTADDFRDGLAKVTGSP